ncbi:hypothetical protein BT63DRAFT_112948 [Microthyrium microscopicum]|uniref:Uncharacterized protein n=1 Tax=Microthyrium microscopicum TaxID=703497 RepID=A0A6A6TXE0_9PEZI|nr:hypothetical protein BT63DRAFT_112948 [Microthyrium microscopicum]
MAEQSCIMTGSLTNVLEAIITPSGNARLKRLFGYQDSIEELRPQEEFDHRWTLSWPNHPGQERILTWALHYSLQKVYLLRVQAVKYPKYSVVSDLVEKKALKELTDITQSEYAFPSSHSAFDAFVHGPVPTKPPFMITPSGCDAVQEKKGVTAKYDKKCADSSGIRREACWAWNEKIEEEMKEFRILDEWYNVLLSVQTETCSKKSSIDLGEGKFIFAVEDVTSRLWFIFQPDGKKKYESRWSCPISRGLKIKHLQNDIHRFLHGLGSALRHRDKAPCLKGYHPYGDSSGRYPELIVCLTGTAPDLKDCAIDSIPGNPALTIKLGKDAYACKQSASERDYRILPDWRERRQNFIESLKEALVAETKREEQEERRRRVAGDMKPSRWRISDKS